jgi:hypothetical protein
MRCVHHPHLAYCRSCAAGLPHPTLEEWCKVHAVRAAACGPLRTVPSSGLPPGAHVALYSLADYHVSSQAAGSYWLRPIQ